MNRVDLKISNDRKFQDVALFVDRPDVLQEISELRNEFKSLIDKIPKPLNLVKVLRDFPNFRLRIDDLLAKYKYPPGFIRSIQAAIDRKVITDNEVRNCYFMYHGDRALNKDLPPISTPREAVLVTFYPYLLHRRKAIIFNDIKELLSGMAESFIPLPKSHLLNLDFKPSIRLHRDWYWKREEGISTERILQIHNMGLSEQSLIDEANIIDQGISAYKALLRRPVF